MQLPLLLLQLTLGDIPVDGSVHLLPREEVSVEQLQADLAAVQRLRPSLAGPIILLASGLATGFGAAVYFATAASTGASLTSGILTIVGGVVVAVACGLMAIGGYLLFNRIEERTAIATEVHRLTLELKEARLQQRRPSSAIDELPAPPSVALLQF